MLSALRSLMNPENWEPNFTKIGKETNLKPSTISEWYKRQLEKGLIVKEKTEINEIKIKNISESEAKERENE